MAQRDFFLTWFWVLDLVLAEAEVEECSPRHCMVAIATTTVHFRRQQKAWHGKLKERRWTEVGCNGGDMFPDDLYWSTGSPKEIVPPDHFHWDQHCCTGVRYAKLTEICSVDHVPNFFDPSLQLLLKHRHQSEYLITYHAYILFHCHFY